MKIQRGDGKQPKDRSLSLLHGEAASSAIENAGCAYQAPSVIAAGADAQGVALLSVITNLVLSVVLIKVPGLVETSKRPLKRTTLILAIVSAVTWLPIILVSIFMRQVNPFLLIGLWTMGLVPTVLLYPLRDNWLASLVPSEKMGRYLGLRSVISGAFFLGSYLMMGYILDITIGDRSLTFAFVLAVAFLSSAITIVLYCGVKPVENPKPVDSKPPLSFVRFLKNARHSHLGTFILFVSLYTFAVNLAGPLFASYMLDDLRFSYMTFTAIISCEYIARILSLTVWGRLVDKLGSLRILNAVAYLIPFVPVLWLFSRDFAFLAGVQIISGTVWAAFDLSVQTFIYKATPPDQRLRYIVYHRSLTSFCVAAGSITGALMLNGLFAISGSQILSLFLISGILRMVVARAMLPKLSLRGIPEAIINPALAAELATVPEPYRTGLYYYPEAWRRLTQRAAAVGGNILGKAVGRISPSGSGLFYRPARWAEYLTRAGAQPFTAAAAPVRVGLYYHPEAWRQLAPTTGREGKAHASNNGLFRNPERWGEYLKHSMVMNAATARVAGDGVSLRQPVFYHPEMWDKYQKSVAADRKTASLRSPAAREGLLHKPEQWRLYQERTATRKPTRAAATTTIPRQPMVIRPAVSSAVRRPVSRPATRPALRTTPRTRTAAAVLA